MDYWDPLTAANDPPLIHRNVAGPVIVAQLRHPGLTQEIRPVHPPSDFESFRQSVADAVEHGDATMVLAAIHPTMRTVAVEHGPAFRELVSGLPVEIWHSATGPAKRVAQ